MIFQRQEYFEMFFLAENVLVLFKTQSVSFKLVIESATAHHSTESTLPLRLG